MVTYLIKSNKSTLTIKEQIGTGRSILMSNFIKVHSTTPIEIFLCVYV